ncbi:tripartite tricarboxylate transporter TctB family protein [Paracoccus sp. MBLB3053]|uniref:Tripartite tricarboxylate transporter TctB family protein n=1 Tax=Paracoccus aurantius TaxID=3073814 RepID=A0ABU2HWW1_9RHOB|nr:tripartite tricarboxylate transporter TctB family protein [Paracoccus sp. MBLB3053]MDS9469503.1 tripartite tricarboxylate transporter TctB family protein [Paracoccus sp. MBLB3053]
MQPDRPIPDEDGMLPLHTPGPAARRPGETVFNLFIFVASLVLLWSAYGISGFEALSSPGAVPMATTLVMLISAGRILLDTMRKPTDSEETLARDILPRPVIFTIVMVVLYAVALAPLGFLPTSVLFLLGMIRYLSQRGWGFCLAVSMGSVALIYLVFRMIFNVLMPEGIVPEGEIIAFISSLFGG